MKVCELALLLDFVQTRKMGFESSGLSVTPEARAISQPIKRETQEYTYRLDNEGSGHDQS